MEIFYAPRGILQIDDARILFPNFRGKETMYNRKGDRNFGVAIDDFETAEKLFNLGWNVKFESGDPALVEDLKRRGMNAKFKPRLDPEEGPRMRLDVKVKYNHREDGTVSGPEAYLWSGNNRTELDEESIGCLDEIERDVVNLDIAPSRWDVNGKTGIAAYLRTIEVHQRINRFQARYESMSAEEKLPF